MALHHDPLWPRAAAWLAGPPSEGIDRSVGVLSIPLNASITPGRCDLAPGAIRSALQRYSLYDFSAGISLDQIALVDCGDIEVRAPAEMLEPCAASITSLLTEHEALVLLGGDNAITRLGAHGLGDLPRIGIVTLDAHLDLRDTSKGPMNGNPIRCLIEDGILGKNIWQIGLQSFANSQAYADFGRHEGIHYVTADQVWTHGIEHWIEAALQGLRHCDAIYFDLDIDVLDRAFAPACPGSRPGGLAPWQVRRAARLMGKSAKVRAMDLVEMDPSKDIADITALSAAAFLLEFVAGVTERSV